MDGTVFTFNDGWDVVTLSGARTIHSAIGTLVKRRREYTCDTHIRGVILESNGTEVTSYKVDIFLSRGERSVAEGQTFPLTATME